MYIPKSQIKEIVTSVGNLIYKNTKLDYLDGTALLLKNDRLYSNDGKELISKDITKRDTIISNDFTRKLISLKSLPLVHYDSYGIENKYFAYNNDNYSEISKESYILMLNKEDLAIDYYMYKYDKINEDNILKLKNNNYIIYLYFVNKYYS